MLGVSSRSVSRQSSHDCSLEQSARTTPSTLLFLRFTCQRTPDRSGNPIQPDRAVSRTKPDCQTWETVVPTSPLVSRPSGPERLEPRHHSVNPDNPANPPNHPADRTTPERQKQWIIQPRPDHPSDKSSPRCTGRRPETRKSRSPPPMTGVYGPQTGPSTGK